jgi:filamentous hemagglutinin family protein
MKPDRASVRAFVAGAILATGNFALGNPQGGTVKQGTATFNSSGSQLTINTSAQAFISWQSFNIGAGETTTFVQPSSSSLVWNQINDSNPSQILGNLNANGYVVLQNQNGFYIGGQAAISAHGLVMTTSPIPMPDLSSGGPWAFTAPPPTASIVNYGQINIGGGGSAFLIAHDVQNHGTISAPGGNVGLYAGQEVLVSTRPDGRGLSAKVTLPAGSVDNTGKLIADGGTIAMQAQVVNQGGLVQADSVANVNGTIQLLASDSLNLGANSVISAKGSSQGKSSGGSVIVKSDNTFSDAAGSKIDISGGAKGGDGGSAEISAPILSTFQTYVDGHAASRFAGGIFTLDPTDLTIDATYIANFAPTLNSGLSQVNIVTDGNIFFQAPWTISDANVARVLNIAAGNSIIFNSGSSLSAGKNWTLSLSAGPQNLTSRPTAARTDGIYLDGNSFIQTQNGDIHVWAANEVLINSDPTTANGSGILTASGGNIDVTAEFGNVNTGASQQGYIFTAPGIKPITAPPYYQVSNKPRLGGVSTAAGGNVTINAGGDVTSFSESGTASGQGTFTDAGAGAYGANAGNVTINAGGNVYGHYVVANGVGTITAGADIGTAAKSVALSLIKGSWNLDAPNGNIYLQEVRNPNGIFNNKGNVGNNSGRYQFDYDPESSVSLAAGNGVYLLGASSSLPRTSDNLPVIYPPSLYISAGAGGVNLLGNVILFPSPDQNLEINTTGGGSLTGVASGAGVTELFMSDSAQTRYVPTAEVKAFSDLDHGSTLALNNLNPVSIDVSGNMQNLTLYTTKETQITVGGDMINANFSGQNLHPNDITSITVGGQIFYSSPYAFVFLPSSIPNLPSSALPPGMANTWESIFKLLVDAQKLANVAIPDGTLSSELLNLAQNSGAFYANTLFSSGDVFSKPELTGNPGFVYNPATGRLGWKGPLSQAIVSALTAQSLTVLVYGKDGFPVTETVQNPDGTYVTHFKTQTVSWAPADQITALYQAAQQSSTTIQYGLRVGGPGQFDVHAGSISLGNSYGILSEGVVDVQTPYGSATAQDVAHDRYANLASVTDVGAKLNVTVDGDLDMLTSTIASMGGGDVNVTSTGGSMNLGSQELFGDATRQIGFGVYSSGRGDVTVTALGNININGSRVAAYDGGDIYIKSLEGDVNAGSGAANQIQVGLSYVDPATGQAQLYSEAVFGSGIVANTLVHPDQVPGSSSLPGDITVLTPRGSIFASQGGILQEALNGNFAGGPTVTLVAGTKPSSPGANDGYIGNIDLGTSGVIGGTVNADASGDIIGLVISRQSSTINAAGTFSGTVLSGGAANLSAGSISGSSTIIGVGGVSISGSLGSGAQVLGQNVSVNGGTAQSTLGTTAAASTTSQSAANTATSDAEKQVASNDNSDEDDKKKKGKGGPALSHRVGRVTVLLPAKS